MSRFCSKCGIEVMDGVTSCPNCGSPIDSNINGEVRVEGTTVNNASNTVGIEKRELVITIILSIVTCGIYGIIWFIGMTNDVNKLTGDNKTSGGMAFLYTLITCGIYGLYWTYNMGKRLNQAGKIHGRNVDDNSILYLVLSIFGLQIVSYALIQNEINGFVSK